MNATPAILAVALVAFAVASKRLSRSAVTGTMLFTALGLAVGPQAFDLVDFTGPLGRYEFVTLVLTGTLVIVLFTDASAIDSSNWRDDIIPARLLGIGLPISIGLGWQRACPAADPSGPQHREWTRRRHLAAGVPRVSRDGVDRRGVVGGQRRSAPGASPR